MAYDPPTSPLGFNFTSSGYTPLTAPLTITFVAVDDQSIGPSGVAPGDVSGQALVYNETQHVSASGFESAAIGDHLTATDQYVNASGLGTEQFGSAYLAYNQFVTPLGSQHDGVGAHLVARQILLNFETAGYAPALPLDFDFLGGLDAVLATGISSSAVGTAFIAHENREVYPFGFVATTIGGFDSVYTKTVDVFANVPFAAGTPTVYNYNKLINGIGLLTQVIAQPTVYNETLSFTPSGPLTQQIGTPDVENFKLEVKPIGLLASSFGSHGVSNDPHFIFITTGIMPGPAGSPTFYGGTQTVTVINQFTETIGAATVSYANREILISGISSLNLTNQHLVKDSEQRFYPQAISGIVGFHLFASQNRSIVIDGGARGSFGEPAVFNANQYIRMLTPFPPDGIQKPGDPLVYNFDLEVRPHGVAELNVYPTHAFIAYQNQIRPGGVTGSIGDLRVRNNDYYHPLDGVDSLLIGNQRVQNAAFGVYASAGDTAEIGVHIVARTLYRYLDGFRVDEHGQAWVSHDPRSVEVYERGVNETAVPQPFISTDPRGISVAGVSSQYVGFHVIQQRLLTLPLIGFSPLGIGTASVQNRDMALSPYEFAASFVGSPTFDLSNRELAVGGIPSMHVGTPSVADQTQRVRCFGPTWLPLTDVVPLPLLYKVPGDPPDAQSIYPNRDVQRASIGAAEFQGNNVVCRFPPDTAAVGSPSVFSNGIFPQGIFPDFVSETYHYLVFNQSITASGVPPIDESPGLSPHDMKHRTIWCTDDVTPQIRDNHPGQNWYDVDDFIGARVGPGLPVVSNYDRELRVSAGSTEEIGSAFSYNFRDRIIVEGVSPPRSGMPKFFAGAPIIIYDGADSLEIGLHDVSRVTETPPIVNGQINPGGIGSQVIGSARVTKWIQELYLSGVSSLQAPGGVDSDLSFNLPLPPFQIPGVGVLAVGTAFISNFIREIVPTGVDSMDLWEDVDNFSRRMRVYGVARPQLVGISSASVGSPRVSSSAQTVLASDFVPTVVPGPALGIQISSVGGGQSFATLGDVRIDAVEEGKAKVYGIRPNNLAAPIVMPVVTPAWKIVEIIDTEFGPIELISFLQSAEEFGEPAFGNAVHASGSGTASGGAHVFTLGDNTLHSCGMATRAIAVGGVPPVAVPEPALT